MGQQDQANLPAFWIGTARPALAGELRKIRTWLEVTATAAAITTIFGYDRIAASWRAPALVAVLFVVLLLFIWKLLTFWRSSEAQRQELSRSNEALKKEIEHLRQDGKNSLRLIEIEGFPINTLMQFVADRGSRPTNNVRLTLYSIHLKLTGTGQHRDATVTYRITGSNEGEIDLPGFYLTICGEGSPKLEELDATFYELLSDPRRQRPHRPVYSQGASGGCKALILPFEAPGIRPRGSFDIELSYTWPSTFRLPTDYWFLDNANCAIAARKVRLAVEFEEQLHVTGNVYRFEPSKFNAALIGAGSVDTASDRGIFYETDNPAADVFYLLIVTALPNTGARKKIAANPPVPSAVSSASAVPTEQT